MARRSAIDEAAAEALRRDLRGAVSRAAVLDDVPAAYQRDATEGRGAPAGSAGAVVLPATGDEVARAVRWCYEHDVAVVPRGGGTGFAGGAVPIEGGVVVGLERMAAIRSLAGPQWRIEAEAGATTASVREAAAATGLLFPPDPGAGHTSQIGGNIATNAGGPHAFKYGNVGHWVTGVEAVVAPGELIRFGGPLRKDVAGYDLRGLMVGSEGTLGVITAAWLRLIPAPEARLPVIALHPDAASGCAAIAALTEAGLEPATLEYLDAGTLAIAAASFPFELPDGAGFMTIAEADGTASAASALRVRIRNVLGAGALAVHAPERPDAVAALWRWRSSVSVAVTDRHGGKVSEDIAVPVERLAEAIAATVEIGESRGLEALSWGHAGDGNLHATVLVGRDDERGQARATIASAELHELAIGLGGSVSGEHGLGWIRRDALARQWPPAAVELHHRVKRAFDPKGLLNPGKKGPPPRT